jgi:hypothetical protein
MAVASAATAAYGAISSAQAQSASYRSQQQAANYNAQANQQNAAAAQSAASANELAMRRANDQRMGEIRAAVAQGTGGFSGSARELVDQDAANAELDALNTRYRGTLQAHGMLAQSNLDEYQSSVAGMNAASATRAGYIGAAASALGASSNYYTMRNMYGGYGGYGG